jgi:hypothetical protein
MPTIELSIDELVLHGFPPGDRARIGDAIQVELERQLATLGLDASRLPSRTRMTSLDAGSFEVGASPSPGTIGANVARNIVRSAIARGDVR